jgi:hypothetical protein
VRQIVESAYGQAVANIFLIAAPIAILLVLAVAFMPNKPLTTKTVAERDTDSGPVAGSAEDVAGIGVVDEDRVVDSSSSEIPNASGSSKARASHS